jgi:predicted transcriptional regulator
VLARQPAVLVGAPDRIVGIVTKVDFIRSMEK